MKRLTFQPYTKMESNFVKISIFIIVTSNFCVMCGFSDIIEYRNALTTRFTNNINSDQEQLIESLYLKNNLIYPLIINNITNGSVEKDRSYETILEEDKNAIFCDETDCSQSNKKTNNDSVCDEDFAEPVDSTTRFLMERLFKTMPPFDFINVPGISLECRVQGIQYLRALDKFKLWALKMYDASAKLPSGLLNGNLNQFGDFDQCLEVQSEKTEKSITGQYCLAFMQIDAPANRQLNQVHELMHSYSMLRSKLSDPGHRVPRFSSFNWAMCVPNGCTPNDTQKLLKSSIDYIAGHSNLSIEVKVNPEMCQTKKSWSISRSTFFGVLFFAVVICIAVASTIYDCNSKNNADNLLNAYSLRRNMRTLFSLHRPEGDIAAVHGIRAINAFMLIIAHKSMALFFIPYVNRTAMSVFIGKPWSVIGRAASLYTDPFIMLSGMLTAYALFGRLNKSEKINLFQEYISRLMRLVPTLGALILFCTFVMPSISSGPQWNQVVTHYSDVCKDNWWRNLLFIHNYFGFEKMCLTHTHHIGIDTQLFAVSPIFILLLWKWPRRGLTVLLILATVSTIMRYYVTYTKRLSNYVHYGTSITQLFSTADNMYILPTHRATVYIVGIVLGYMLRNIKKIDFTPFQLKAGHALATAAFCAAFFIPAFMGNITYKYDPVHAAWYAAFAPIAWCFSFAWIIFTSHLGYESFLSKMFSWRGFLISTRLSYTIYLSQFPVFFYNVGKARHAEFYGLFRSTLNIPEYGFIIIFSIALTLLFESPFQNIKKCIFKRTELNGSKKFFKNNKVQ